jgi:N-carbamoyl-L-amino-acid hydrolase
MATPLIDAGRLRDSLLRMARIGATAGGGVTRLALSDEDREARELFAAWAGELGLAVRVDDMGTQYARYEGADPTLAPVLVGSHLDSVPLGGKFDGPLGVLTALEVVRALRERGIRPARSVEVVNFTNEEGARFEPAMVASAVLAGRYTPEFVYGRADADGRAFGAELERIGYRGDRRHRPGAVHAYLELHIEQGPVLEAEGLPIGAVEGILGIRWLNVTLTGQAQHAGPSPMRSRRDAMVAAAGIVVGLRDLALEYPDPVVATVGRLRPHPGIVNQIPGQVVMSADVRHWTAEGLAELGRRAEEMIDRIAAEERVEVEVELLQDVPPTTFDRRLVGLLEAQARALDVPCRRLVAGAGHDAKYMSEIAPTAMLFVRTVGGKSHCETEDVHWQDVGLAGNVLLGSVLALADER